MYVRKVVRTGDGGARIVRWMWDTLQQNHT